MYQNHGSNVALKFDVILVHTYSCAELQIFTLAVQLLRAIQSIRNSIAHISTANSPTLKYNYFSERKFSLLSTDI